MLSHEKPTSEKNANQTKVFTWQPGIIFVLKCSFTILWLMFYLP